VPGELAFERQYANQEWERFEDIVFAFFKEAGVTEIKPLTACFAVAGPVDRNTVAFTNRSGWVICGENLGKTLGIPKVKLINDFVANGYGLLTLDEAKETVSVQDVEGRETRSGLPIACIGAGTGLGECFMTAGGDGVYESYPSEGGHAEFAPRTDLQIELLRYLKKAFAQKSRVSVERVVSGIGIANIYKFLRQAECDKHGQPAEPGKQLKDQVVAEVDEAIMGAGDQMGGKVAQNASSCGLCKVAMDIMFTTYGSEAGVAALKWLPYGGLYIAGGIAPKNIDYITEEGSKFMEAFYDKGRVSKVLRDVPVKVVLAEDIGQRGAQLVAMRMLMDARSSKTKKVKAMQSSLLDHAFVATKPCPNTEYANRIQNPMNVGRQRMLSMGEAGRSMQTRKFRASACALVTHHQRMSTRQSAKNGSAYRATMVNTTRSISKLVLM